jgi:hypothetical protein
MTEPYKIPERTSVGNAWFGIPDEHSTEFVRADIHEALMQDALKLVDCLKKLQTMKPTSARFDEGIRKMGWAFHHDDVVGEVDDAITAWNEKYSIDLQGSRNNGEK